MENILELAIGSAILCFIIWHTRPKVYMGVNDEIFQKWKKRMLTHFFTAGFFALVALGSCIILIFKML